MQENICDRVGNELYSDEHDAAQVCHRAAELEAKAKKQVQAGAYEDATRLLKEAPPTKHEPRPHPKASPEPGPCRPKNCTWRGAIRRGQRSSRSRPKW